MKLDELEEELERAVFRPPVRLSAGERVLYPEKLINTHLRYLKANSGNRAFKPYYDRLLELLKNKEQ